jgi:hypothetical protein
VNCPNCKGSNEEDAAFCVECGRSLSTEEKASSKSSRKNYLFMFVLVPILAIVAGIGYYKFFLPDGIAAVVNGEGITLSELESVAGAQGTREDRSGRFRYQLLDQLIAERIVLQEARKAGISLSTQEIASAMDTARAAMGSDDASFKRKISSQFGSLSAFENALARRLLIKKFIAEKVVPPGADPETARIAMDQWYDGVSRKAAVRIALAEQGAGCGGCNNKASGQPTCRKGTQEPCCAAEAKAKSGGCNRTAQKAASPGQTQTAVDAGLQYWHAKYGPDAVTARTTDFGCHVQVDIMKDETLIGSLSYQNGSIQEL